MFQLGNKLILLLLIGPLEGKKEKNGGWKQKMGVSWEQF